ncbi:hypothetical protein HanXRQr2_Chr10g0455401 [Helianthus annuus]|uniref:Uncharacterized protein n=1 Tax=Helianthus annuus TaxID=4232 RepID=A0A9K3I0N3_HELAN|nr:hypothetical protein HanXRQr2_Chr10g0455401 [Helianthus annuus]KAJ0884958.1 hypothetical protein HanPSC8_Chr10g0439841 [Helianthus annuus]
MIGDMEILNFMSIRIKQTCLFEKYRTGQNLVKRVISRRLESLKKKR